MPAALLFGAGADPSSLVTRARVPVDRAAPVRAGQFVSLVYRYTGVPGVVDAGTWARGVARALTNLNGSGTFVVASGPVDGAESSGLFSRPFVEIKIRTLNSIPAGLTWAALLYQLGPLRVADTGFIPVTVGAELVGAFVASGAPGGTGGAAALADAASDASAVSVLVTALKWTTVLALGAGLLYVVGPAARRLLPK